MGASISFERGSSSASSGRAAAAIIFAPLVNSSRERRFDCSTATHLYDSFTSVPALNSPLSMRR